MSKTVKTVTIRKCENGFTMDVEYMTPETPTEKEEFDYLTHIAKDFKAIQKILISVFGAKEEE